MGKLRYCATLDDVQNTVEGRLHADDLTLHAHELVFQMGDSSEHR